MVQVTRGGFAYPGTSLEFKTGTWRVERPFHLHRVAPCHGACPAGEDAQAYLALVEEEHFQEAWENLVSANPLPAITGRVCHHPCESACNRQYYDDPVAIHNVERYLGDRALEEDWPYPVSRPAADAPKVAVVGAGPAGLSAAYHLLRQGLAVTLFEMLPEPGGLLRTAIPAYRLPRDILNGELGRLISVGMDYRGGQRLGRDIFLDELREEYRAVFLGPGTQKSRDWSIDGATPEDLHVGLDLLKEWMAVGKIPTWESVAIVGAGNTAVDLARVLKRAGVREVHIISHKAIPAPGIPPEDTMPAIPREITQALEEGVQIHEHRGVQRLILRGERITGIEMVHMKKLPGKDGRLHRVAFEGTETLLHVDQVIPAIGQVLDPDGLEVLVDGASFLKADGWGRLPGHPDVFTGGDARGDRGTVTEAVGDGRRAALAIASYVAGEPIPEEHSSEPIPFEAMNVHYFEPAPRPREPVLPPERRMTGCAEIEQGLDKVQVVGEGHRCFSCGNCFACDNCWTLCPDTAVLKTTELARDGSHYVFDYDYCKGCGICAHECPCGFILMEPEHV